MFFWKICKNSKNNFFTEHFQNPEAASHFVWLGYGLQVSVQRKIE